MKIRRTNRVVEFFKELIGILGEILVWILQWAVLIIFVGGFVIGTFYLSVNFNPDPVAHRRSVARETAAALMEKNKALQANCDEKNKPILFPAPPEVKVQITSASKVSPQNEPEIPQSYKVFIEKFILKQEELNVPNVIRERYIGFGLGVLASIVAAIIISLFVGIWKRMH